jgi:hypothetical protein
LEGNFVEKKEISGYGEGNNFLGSGNTGRCTWQERMHVIGQFRKQRFKHFKSNFKTACFNILEGGFG